MVWVVYRMYKWIACAVVIFLLVVTAVYSWNVQTYEDYLQGFWVADDQFCAESDIEGMMLYISAATAGVLRSSRTGYIVISNDKSNQTFKMNYRRGWGGPSVGRYSIYADITFEDDQLWPKSVWCCADIKRGTLRIYKDKTIYARLFKDPKITHEIMAAAPDIVDGDGANDIKTAETRAPTALDE
jgi:hypothetical protein